MRPRVPSAGEVAMANVRGFPSRSVPESVITTGVSSRVDALVAWAVGARLPSGAAGPAETGCSGGAPVGVGEGDGEREGLRSGNGLGNGEGPRAPFAPAPGGPANTAPAIAHTSVEQ